MASKRYKKLLEKIKEPELNPEPIEKLLPKIKSNCTTKFDESLDLSFLILQLCQKTLNRPIIRLRALPIVPSVVAFALLDGRKLSLSKSGL